ncbi:MAG: penicillin-binding protein 2, partial [Xanthobacteraceae bacterium]|nr:penicillin-binding protein 2 [Xanthobacteraceae bacterium]
MRLTLAHRDGSGGLLRRLQPLLRPAGGATARFRIGLLILGFAVVYGVIALRLIHLGIAPESHIARRGSAADAVAASRPDILDRAGRLLATDIKAASLYADPRRIIDVDEAVELITAVLPDLDATEVRDRLASRRSFVWLKREITPQQLDEIHHLGVPGVGFLRENKRVYPAGFETAHVLGHVNVDNAGIAGLEKWIDGRGLAELHQAGLASGRALEPVALALDLSVQHAARDELIAAMDRYKANAAAGLVL